MSNPTPDKLPPLYSLTTIGIATFLGSALAAGYMLASNYTALGMRKMGKYALYGSIGIVGIVSFVPAQFTTSLTTLLMVTIGQVLLVLFITNKLQGSMMSSFEAMGGKYYPVWRGILVGFGASVILLITMIFLAVLFGGSTPAT